MTAAAPARAAAPGFEDIRRVLADRAPALSGLHAAFAPLEAAAHQLLPRLAALRPTIGDTPLVPVPSRAGRGRVWLKTESANASGTVKSRTAYALVCAAVARAGTPEVRLAEYSGGSLAVALAELCGQLGLDIHLVVPYGAPDRLVCALRRQGAGVSQGRPGTGFLGSMDEAVRVAEREDRRLLLQHCAAEAAAMHREHTGAEIIGQLSGYGVEPVALAAAVGTGGSLAGAAMALTGAWPHCRNLAVFPTEAVYGDERAPSAAPRMNGTGGLGLGIRQPLLSAFPEGWISYTDIAYPQALEAMRRLRREHGIAVSGSGAGAWLSASAEVDQGPPGRNAVAVVAGRGTIEEWEHATAR
ncbi:pyridoxal-phosphate dependent enzyme [Streptomyces sp. NBC_01408]|uniref:pyridoxal-phosphate dependent enzyme n=1 Tax=Streptomyces sp. NBC_01408 TaxID=2903855 RepID=UPI00225955DB|nr:pyridoxal-phosphate dependent enzyme [Streptomyces sp. NBC_01408]MCX4696585.1 pyridoxal-phosphate dependent enzyme [Streptomyces sp. NBC_01408]